MARLILSRLARALRRSGEPLSLFTISRETFRNRALSSMSVLLVNSDSVMILHIFSSFVQEAPSIGTFLAGPGHNHWQEGPWAVGRQTTGGIGVEV